MALAAVKTFVSAEVLFASDLNALNTNILNNPTSLISPWTANLDADGFDLLDLGEVEYRDEAADPTADGRWRRSGDELTWRTQDARTNTTTRNLAIWADTTGAPAASIGIGLLFQAESADENPSDFGAVDFVASDVTAASEDTDCVLMGRTAGAALAEIGRLFADGGFRPGTVAPTTPAANTLYRDLILKVWAYVTISGGTPTLQADVNVSSITDNGVGDITLNFATPFSAAANQAWAGQTHGSTSHFLSKAAVAVASTRVLIFSDGGAAADVDFSVLGVGAQ